MSNSNVRFILCTSLTKSATQLKRLQSAQSELAIFPVYMGDNFELPDEY